MSAPIDRLRAADPAAGLGAQPDERAEADLRLLLAEARPASAPARRPERRAIGPLLVTAVVAAAVIAVTATALAIVHPRTDVGGTTPASPNTSSIQPPYIAEDCAPQKVLPFECGTYRSVYGAPSVTGDTGGPAKDPLSMSFTTAQGGLLLTVRSASCFAAVVPVRYDGKRLIRTGTLLVGEASGCTGPGTNDARHWADAFLRGPLEVDASVGGIAFDSSSAMVTFQYEGAAGIGEAQLPRTDRTCVPAHVQPFTCAVSRSTKGTGTLAFLAAAPYTLRFEHSNGELTAVLAGKCNTMSVVVEPEPGPAGLVVAIPGASTAMGCFGVAGAHDAAVSAFFRGELTLSTTGSGITFTKGGTSATFTR